MSASIRLPRMGRNVSKRPLEILRRAQGGVPRESGALSRQPAVLLTYGIGGMYELGFGSSPDRGKHQQTSDQVPIWLLTNFSKNVL